MAQIQLSKESRLFAQKVARSITEIEPNINNTADIVVIMEVLGYSMEMVRKYGFADFHALANYTYDFINVYEVQQKNKDKFIKSLTVDLPKTSKKIEEAIALVFPWMASMAMLFLTGVSLWMAIGFPLKITTAFVTGVFLGVIITEGTIQVFNRLLLYYYEQNNICEIKRLMRRNYLMTGAVLLFAIGFVSAVGYAEKISFHLVLLTIISMVTISLHRTSYMIIYGLKKALTLIVSYSLALTVLLTVYYFGELLIPSGVTRYFVGLLLAFFTLSFFAAYHHRQVLKVGVAAVEGEKPHFFKAMSVADETIKSRFGVQLWETLPYSIYGMFYLVTMFSDRILSWIYNPQVLTGNYGLPMAFNTTYHIGADMALLVILPTSIIQYIIMMPIYIKINNLTAVNTVSQQYSINAFIQMTYKKLITFSLIAAVATAVLLNLVAPTLMEHAGISQTSIHILRIASIANVFMAIFGVNASFLMWFNKMKCLIVIVMVSSVIVISNGVLSDHAQLQNLTMGYLAASVFAAVASLFFYMKSKKDATNILFSKIF